MATIGRCRQRVAWARVSLAPLGFFFAMAKVGACPANSSPVASPARFFPLTRAGARYFFFPFFLLSFLLFFITSRVLFALDTLFSLSSHSSS